jgi:phosphoribosylformimino-5-aminoimidazole carboxamide ribotide isomerase
MQIIPAIDLRGGKCVRLQQGDYARETIFGDDPFEVARQWLEQGAERIHLVDLDGARAGRPVNTDVVSRIVAELPVPCQLGGGLRDDRAAAQLLEEVGVERIIIGTQALKQPEWFAALVERYPGRIALGVDARNSLVATEGWLDVSQMPMLELVRRYTGLPLAAVIYTNIANDGMLQGVDDRTLDDLVELAQLGLPTVASGGVTTLEDVRQLADRSRRHPLLVGAIVGRALYEGTLTLASAMAAARPTPS